MRLVVKPALRRDDRSMERPVAVLFCDLNLTVEPGVGAATWAELKSGEKKDVVAGACVLVTDGEDTFTATVTQVLDVGPRFAIQWDLPQACEHVHTSPTTV